MARDCPRSLSRKRSEEINRNDRGTRACTRCARPQIGSRSSSLGSSTSTIRRFIVRRQIIASHRSRVSLSGALNKLFRVLLLTCRESVGKYCDKGVSARRLRDVLIHIVMDLFHGGIQWWIPRQNYYYATWVRRSHRAHYNVSIALTLDIQVRDIRAGLCRSAFSLDWRGCSSLLWERIRKEKNQ